ncbi:hypothetical protein ABTM24_19865, partial [Acinetobacter baumannii]
ALVNEYVNCAKHQISLAFSRFINAISHKLTPGLFVLPTLKNNETLSLIYSLPKAFIQSILNNYPEEKALAIFSTCNEINPHMARKRGSHPP